MKTPEQVKYLPQHFNEQDKIDYELYVAEAKRIFKNIDDYVIHIGVIAYINEQKGLKQPSSEEEVKACMDKYDLRTCNVVIETPQDPDFKMENTLKPIIIAESGCSDLRSPGGSDSSSNIARPRLDTVVSEE